MNSAANILRRGPVLDAWLFYGGRFVRDSARSLMAVLAVIYLVEIGISATPKSASSSESAWPAASQFPLPGDAYKQGRSYEEVVDRQHADAWPSPGSC